MPDGRVIEFAGVTKRFGSLAAVSDVTARVEPGRVTGFLGPNGAGKTTTMRILLGLVRASAGSATVGGVPYRKLPRPLHAVGAVLESSSFHPGRTGADHLRVYAHAAGIARGRVDEVLGLVGLADVAGRRVGGYSLGMRQRLGLACALLGDPGVLVLDEPSNGLDPEGIRWLRGFLRQLAREGRTVFVSSHLLAEIQQTVDALLIIAEGRLVFQGPLADLADPDELSTLVDSPDRAALSEALRGAGLPFETLRSGLTVRSAVPAEVGAIAAGAGVALSSLQRRGPSLEEVFLELVNGVRVHPSAIGGTVGDTDTDADTDADADGATHPGGGEVGADEDGADDESTEEHSVEDSGTGTAEDWSPEDGADAPEADLGDWSPEDVVSTAVEEERAPEGDRPWQTHVKTDADREADEFFASFDGAGHDEESGDTGEEDPR